MSRNDLTKPGIQGSLIYQASAQDGFIAPCSFQTDTDCWKRAGRGMDPGLATEGVGAECIHGLQQNTALTEGM